MQTPTSEDLELVRRLGERTGIRLVARGRADAGELGGAIFVAAPDGRESVVTVSHGTLEDARRVAVIVNALQERGAPVPRHDQVLQIGGRVVVVQERLAAGPDRTLTTQRLEEIVAINDRFAGMAEGLVGLPPLVEWFRPGGRSAADLLAGLPDVPGVDGVRRRIILLTQDRDDVLTGDDVVHIDLTAANVLFDTNDRAVGVVDWSLGAYRGDRCVALVQTRFDREWFERRPGADAEESAAAARLDDLLAERIAPDGLRVLWAFWFLHQLPRAAAMADPAALAWQLEFARARLA